MALVKLIRYFFLLACIVLTVGEVLADGSRHMYPDSVRGNRAYLVSGVPFNGPFHNQAAHYAYAKRGERIAVASSAQGIGAGLIRITAPNGQVYLSTPNSSVGRIAANGLYTNRTAELAGPRVGYTPMEVLVGPQQEGVWKVEFLPTRPVEDNRTTEPPVVRANANWIQQDNSMNIAAWDVSVRDETDSHWVDGRVFTHVLGLYIQANSLNEEEGAFYGKNYVLTRDGYIYQVDGNGSHGIYFYYFVNSSGILDSQGRPSYKSSNAGEYAPFHSPNAPDNGLHVTHKMMYTFPDITMPASASGQVPGGSTWLYQPSQIATITNVSFQPIEIGNYLTKKGGYVGFETNYAGRYRITISPKSAQYNFPRREIIVDASAGVNRYLWNGLDGQGNFVPIGRDYPIDVSIALLEGEIHFPYFDMEINPRGIRISRYNPDGSYFGPAYVYWDDSDITPGAPGEASNPPVNTDGAGISSYENGHKWGSYRNHEAEFTQRYTVQDPVTGIVSLFIPNNMRNSNYGAYSYGNERAMDTWSYAAQVEEHIESIITVEVADLLVTSITADKDTIELGDEITYTIVVKNDGPSDAMGATFNYALPSGFFTQLIDVSTSCGQVTSSGGIGTNQISAQVNLPNQCEITFSIRASTGGSVPDGTYGFYTTTTDVIRPVGITDPDAISTNVLSTVPVSAIEECNGNTACNNIMLHNGVFLLEPYNERGQVALIKSAEHIDANRDGYHQVGEQVRYTFVLQNIGQVHVRDITMRDDMLSNTPIPFDSQDLSPGAGMSIELYYTITQADLDRGVVINTARVLGKNPRGFDVKDISGTTASNDRPTELRLYKRPEVFLRKIVANQGTGESGQFTVGDVIRYRFDIVNRDTFTIEDVRVEDPMLIQPQLNIGVLAVGQSTEVYGHYEIVMSDIGRGYVENTAWLWGIDVRNGQRVRVQSGTSFDNMDATVIPVAQPPIAIADDFTQYMNTSENHHILGNDVEGTSSIRQGIIEIVRHPIHGAIDVDSNGHVTYTPGVGFIGTDSFSYRFVDASRLVSNTAEVNIQVIPSEVISVEDYFELDYNRYVDLDVLKNDYTVGGSELDLSSLHLVDLPVNGVVNVGTDGYIRYTPNTNFTGVDYFSYRIMDTNGIWSEVTTVTVLTRGLLIPNVITPNGDGNNDTFSILGMYAFERISLEIVDRYGKSVYSSSNYKNDWGAEGREDGTYYYIITGFSEGKKVFHDKGTITVIRMLNY